MRGQQHAGWPALAGAELRGVLPISDALLRELLAEALGDGAVGPGIRLTGASVLPGEVIRLELSVGGSLLSKRLTPEVHLAGIHGLPGAPAIRLTIPRQYRWLVAQVLRQRNLAYVRSEDAAIEVNIRGLVEELWGPDAAAVLPLLKRADIRSERGSLLVDFEVTLP